MIKRLVIILFFTIPLKNSIAQVGASFQHLTTVNGLSYIGATQMCADQKGNLWIATGNGLNMFNGKAVERYFSSDYPQLRNSNVLQVLCDQNNFIWVLTWGGYVTVLDEKRQFHQIILRDSGRLVRPSSMLMTTNKTVCLYTAKGNYTFTNTSIENKDSVLRSQFQYKPLQGLAELQLKGAPRVFHFDEDHYLLVYPNEFVKINTRANRVEKKFDIPGAKALCKWGGNQLLFFDQLASELKTVDLITGNITLPLKNVKTQRGDEVAGIFLAAEKVSATKYLLGTEASGIYVYDTLSKTALNYSHSFVDPNSIASNHTDAIAAGKDGWVFVTSIPNGISYFKLDDVVSSQYIFSDDRSNGYDGYIAGIATADNNNYYLGTANGMLKWTRSNNTTRFIDFVTSDGKSIFANKQVGSLAIDYTGKVWATIHDNGVIVMDKNEKLIKHFRYDSTDKKALKVRRVNRIINGPDGYVWLCGRNGLSRINPANLEVDNFENTPLDKFRSMHVVPLLFEDKNNLLIAASFDGLFHYNLLTKELKEVETFKRFKRDGVLDLKVDSSGNIYIGNRAGVKILFKNGHVKELRQKNGLFLDRAEGILIDEHNRVWIGNDIGLACYNPSDSSLKAFDVRYGLSIYGYRVGSYFRTSNGEFILGTPRGLQYFHPDSLYNKNVSLNVSITRLETKNINAAVSGNQSFSLRAGDNNVSFYFGTVDFSPHLRTYFEYRLDNLDKGWIKLADQSSVRYNSLRPGDYVFRVRISNDNINWKESDNLVNIHLAAPFYQTWWFKVIVLLIVLSIIWYVLKYYQSKQRKQREELEAQVVINYFASQINRHLKTEDILWDVAKNCISKLNFEDCVIYLIDEDRNVLVQKAAWGPKLAKDLTIHEPIEIPVGHGIVGSVAQTAKPESIGNTELDKRYIADDAKRLSELAVPLIINNKVIGVIDSEHSRKNFFTKRHLNILSTVAVLCATQIERAKAEQEEQEAQLVINYFASQIHSRYKTDDLLWDVARNLIGKMGFEDCMIYLWNDDKTVLVQKAGYGSKGSMQAIMDKTAYHIPRGKGIVGAAVESRNGLIVNDTSKDQRYFTADEKIMLSELCVPLIHDNEVLGAINTEHHRKNFFTTKHLKMLSTIAALCANQLQRIRAEEEKQQARIEALQNKQKAIETRLQSLRLQMNPHFLFNALNSVQQMILANEEMVATRYLSKFSKLLRTILVHSDKEFVTLKEELEILNLYIDLESMRFKDSFSYSIECDDNIDTDEIKLPTLLIQPFVENAIWHGLMHKEGERLLQVKFSEYDDSIHCIVEDNGIGREKSHNAKLATGQGKKHTSKGIQVSMERLEAMGNGNGSKGSLEIIDLKDENGNAAGTRVKIVFPTQNN